MAEEVSQTVIKATQSSLGKYVKRPPLTEKLLGRPPFKYLHDIFTSVMKSTGFMEGLFTGPEMNPDSFKDRDSKIAYLDKVIRMVGLVNGKEVNVKPSAIVAGKEAEKTNTFLQELAGALGKKINNADLVKRVLKGEGPAAAGVKKQPREDSKERRKDDRKDERKDERKDDGSRDRKRDREESGKERSRDKEKDRDRENEKDKDRQRERDKDREKEKGKDREREKDKDRESRESRGKERDRGRGDKDDDKDRKRGRGDDKKPQGSANNEGGDSGGQKGSKDDEGSPNRIPRPSSAKGNRRLRDGRRAPASADSEEEQQRRHRGDAE